VNCYAFHCGNQSDSTEPGGAFGGRNANFLEPVAALLARKTGRPVRMIMSRAEVLEATGPCSAASCGSNGRNPPRTADYCNGFLCLNREPTLLS